MPLLPHCPDRQAYSNLQTGTVCWLPAMRAVCDRHGLAGSQLERLSEGTNVVFAADDRIIKLFPPHWIRNAAAERAVAERLYGELPVATPAIEAAGMLEGWPLPWPPHDRVYGMGF